MENNELREYILKLTPADLLKEFGNIEKAFDNKLKIDSKIYELLIENILDRKVLMLNLQNQNKAFYMAMYICLKYKDYNNSTNILNNYEICFKDKEYAQWYYYFKLLIKGKRMIYYYFDDTNRLFDNINKINKENYKHLDYALTDLFCYYVDCYNTNRKRVEFGKQIIRLIDEISKKANCYNDLSFFVDFAKKIKEKEQCIINGEQIIFALENDNGKYIELDDNDEINSNEEEKIPSNETQNDTENKNEVSIDLSKDKDMLATLKNKYIYVVGGIRSKAKPNFIEYAKQIGFTPNHLVFVDYDECTNFAWDRKVKDNDDIIGIIIGATPHKGKSIGKFGSIIEKISNEKGYPRVYPCFANSSTKKYQISFEGFKNNIVQIIIDYNSLNFPK